jgi:sugar O-acyltransferase (sialic acid O-acetyltransferase NeuD family)
MKKVKKFVVLGGGYGFYELLPLIEAVNKSNDEKIEIIGILDDNSNLKKVSNYPVLGPLRSWERFDDSVSFVYAIGSYNSRMSRLNTLNETRIPIERFPSLIHPDADIMVPRSSVGYGCIIHGGVRVHPLTSIGNFCSISVACVIGVKNFVGSFSLFAAGVYTGTNIKFGSCSFMGTNCVIAPDITIGPGSQIGVGSVVFRDVEAGHKLLGNPARSYSKDQVSEDLLIHDMEDFNYLKYLSDRLR